MRGNLPWGYKNGRFGNHRFGPIKWRLFSVRENSGTGVMSSRRDEFDLLNSQLTLRGPRTKHLCHPCMLWSHRSVDFACNALTSSDNVIDRQRIVFCPHSTQVSDTNHNGFQSNFLKWNRSRSDEVDFAPHAQQLKISEELEKSIT